MRGPGIATLSVVRVEATPAGLFLPEVDLHVDPVLPVDAAIVTHGHGDHARALPARMYATPETAAIVRARFGDTDVVELRYGEPADVGSSRSPARLTLHPSGHVLGSAGALLEHGNERLFVTGDVKLRPSRTCAPAEVPECDTLVVESTFGLPVFRFPETDALRAAIAVQARVALDAGDTPVFLAHALGKGPEVAKILGDAGIPVSLHGAVSKMTSIYGAFGVVFPDAIPYAADALAGRALVAPFSCRNQPMITKIRNLRVIAVTGWALLDAAYDRYGAQGLVPLSDHAGHDELLRIVALSRARRVRTVHGYAEAFARVLALAGIDAAPVEVRRPEEA
jgi:putative mRNA 3-end processing factor